MGSITKILKLYVMKKLALTIGTFLALFIISCEGPDGPPGPPGPPGADGVNIVGETYELANINFTNNANDVQYTFSQSLVEGDAVLVYRLESITDGLDVWEPLPTATFTFSDGNFLQYRFNYTLGDVIIIAESNDLSTIDPSLTQNQVFRIVVVPSDLLSTLDTNNLEAVMKSLNMNESNVQKLQMN